MRNRPRFIACENRPNGIVLSQRAVSIRLPRPRVPAQQPGSSGSDKKHSNVADKFNDNTVEIRAIHVEIEVNST